MDSGRVYSGRSCGNNLWILRRVAERAIEFNVHVYCILVDYKGAFDALNRTTLGRVLSLFLSPNMVCRVMCLYFDAKATVRVNNATGLLFESVKVVRPHRVFSRLHYHLSAGHSVLCLVVFG